MKITKFLTISLILITLLFLLDACKGQVVEDTSGDLTENIDETVNLIQESQQQFSEDMIKNRLTFPEDIQPSGEWIKPGGEVPLWLIQELVMEDKKIEDYFVISCVVAGEFKTEVGKTGQKEFLLPVAFKNPDTGKFYVRDVSFGTEEFLEAHSIFGGMGSVILDDNTLTANNPEFISTQFDFIKSNFKIGNQIAFIIPKSVQILEVPEDIAQTEEWKKIYETFEAYSENNTAFCNALVEGKDLPEGIIKPSVLFISKAEQVVGDIRHEGILLMPELVGNYKTSVISGGDNISRNTYRHFRLHGNYIYLPYYVYDKKSDKNYYGFKIIDITNQTNPKEIGDYVQIDKFWEWAGLSENYVYLTNGGYGFEIIDVTNKGNPHIIGSCKTPQSADAGIIKGDFAYIIDISNGLQIIDISNKKDPKIISSNNDWSFLSCNSIVINGSYAFIPYYNDRDEYILQITEVANKENLKNLGSCNFGDFSPLIISIDKKYAYLSCSNRYNSDNFERYIKTVDITDKENPSIVGSLEISDLNRVLNYCKDGDYIYTANAEAGVSIIDVSIPNDPKFIGNFKTDGWALFVYVENNIGFISDTNRGLIIVDFSNINNPVIISVCDVPGYVPYAIIDNYIAYVEYVVKDFERNYVEEIGVQIYKIR